MTGSGNINADTSTTPPERGPAATSIWAVARAAGVSHQTVSRVINGKPHVRAETRALVLATIEELGFTPNRAAQALAGGPVRAVTVLTADTAAYGYAAALRGIEEARAPPGSPSESAFWNRTPRASRRTSSSGSAGRAAIVIAFESAGARALRPLPQDFPWGSASWSARPPGTSTAGRRFLIERPRGRLRVRRATSSA